MRTENLFTSTCPVCAHPMIVQIDGQTVRSHGKCPHCGKNCRKEMRANPKKYHKCNTKLCTGRKFDELDGRMLCEEQKKRWDEEVARREKEAFEKAKKGELETPKVKRA